MKANFTVTNATFRDYLSNLSNPNTINLTNGICQAVSDKIIILQPLYQSPNTSLLPFFDWLVYYLFWNIGRVSKPARASLKIYDDLL